MYAQTSHPLPTRTTRKKSDSQHRRMRIGFAAMLIVRRQNGKHLRSTQLDKYGSSGLKKLCVDELEARAIRAKDDWHFAPLC